MSLSSREQRMQTICLLVISFIVGAAALYWLQPVMIPFMIAVFIALVLTPLIELIVRYLRFPRPLAVIATVILIFIIFGIFGGMITVSIKGLDHSLLMTTPSLLIQIELKIFVINLSG